MNWWPFKTLDVKRMRNWWRWLRNPVLNGMKDHEWHKRNPAGKNVFSTQTPLDG